MRNFKLQMLLIIASVLVSIKPVKADIEGVAIVPEQLSNVSERVIEQFDNITAAQKAIDDATQAVQGGLNQATGIINTVSNPQAIIDQATGIAKTTVMNGIGGVLDGTKNDDEIMEAVEETYVPSYNESDIKRRRGFDEKNKNSIRNLALFYGRTIVLRKELREEESPDKDDISFKTIKEAQDASNELMIKSLERWNKILEVDANINEFKGAVDTQNFRRDEEQEEN